MTTFQPPPVLPDASAAELTKLQRLAEATLGRSVHDAATFRRNCCQFGLGEALNIEHSLAD